MNTFRRFGQHSVSLPSTAGWYLADLSEARGKQELFTRQSPQKLKAMREHVLIEASANKNHLQSTR